MENKEKKQEKIEAPEYIIDNINLAAHNARKALFYLTIASIYIIISILSIKDKDLILNISVTLPILQTHISFLSFVIVSYAVFWILAFYYSIHFRIFGKYINLLTNYYMNKDYEKINPYLNVIYLQSGFNNSLQSILFYLQKYLPILFGITISFLIEPKVLKLQISIFKEIIILISYILLCIYVIILSDISNIIRINIIKFLGIQIQKEKSFLIFIFIIFIPTLIYLKFSRGLFQYDLSYQILTQPPIIDYPSTYWADLKKRKLIWANCTGAILKRADLRYSKFEKSNLTETDLSGTFLKNVEFYSSTFVGTILDSAKIIDSRFDGCTINRVIFNTMTIDSADFIKCKFDKIEFHTNISKSFIVNSDLSGSFFSNSIINRSGFNFSIFDSSEFDREVIRDSYFIKSTFKKCKSTNRLTFENSNLSYAVFDSADFSKIKLDSCNLYRASFIGSQCSEGGFVNTDLRGSNLYRGKFDNAILSWSNLKYAILDSANLISAQLDSCSLLKASLRGTNLGSADLQKADFKGAVLEGAIMPLADLRSAKNLSMEQLSKVYSLYKAKLDTVLADSIDRFYPELWIWPPTGENSLTKK